MGRASSPDRRGGARAHAMTTLDRLAETIRERRQDTSAKSYTRSLLDGGSQRCAKKLGEEAAELVIAAVAQGDDAVKAEAADLLYHLLVLLEVRNVPLADVLAVLEGRMGVSGHVEKAGRRPAGG